MRKIKFHRYDKDISFLQIAILWILVLLGCTPSLTIRSDPSEAIVNVSLPNGQKKELGKTPFDISYTEIEKVLPLSALTGEMIPLLFEKKEFESMTVMVPASHFGMLSTSVLSKMKPMQDSTLSATQLLQYLHNTQKFVNSGNFQRGLEEIDKAIEKDPKFIRALSMKASIYFVQKKWDDSLIWYEKALSLDNSFDEAIKMIAEIKKKKGDDK